MKVPLGIVSITDYQKQLVNQVLDNQRLSYGPMTRKFEELLAKEHEVDHAIFMASGTCALDVMLEAAKELYEWPDGSEVIIPATTFIATMSSVRRAGLVPILCDVELDTFNLAPNQIDQHVTHKTVAVLVVHLLGRAANMTAICTEANRLNLKILEDCCEAVGVRHAGKAVGSFGTAGAISTYVCHHVSTGVGGAVLTRDKDLATICRSLMQHGRNPSYLCLEDDDNLNDSEVVGMMAARYEFDRWGHSYRSTEMEAALGVGFIETLKFEAERSQRQLLAFELAEMFYSWKDWIADAVFPNYDSNPLFYPLVLRTPESCQGLSEAFEKAGIETRPLMPLLTQPIVQSQGLLPIDFPNADDLSKRAFLDRLPSWHGKGTR